MAKRLLILANDEPVTTRALALDLTEAGYRVETAFDGEEATRKLEGANFDLLIAPDEPRGEAAGVIAVFRRGRPMGKVVLMTTDGGKKGRIERRSREVRVSKPFDLEDFRSVIDELLEAKDSATGSAT